MPAPSGAALRAKAPPFGYLAPLGSYVRTAEGWLYVAAILDLYSRRIVGWATGASNLWAISEETGRCIQYGICAARCGG